MPSIALKQSVNLPTILGVGEQSNLVTNLIGYWKLDSSSSWTGSVGPNLNFGESYVDSVAGKISGAAQFNGSNYLVSDGNLSVENLCSISFWFKCSNASGPDVLTGLEYPTSYRCLSIDGDLYFQAPDASVVTSAGSGINYCDYAWHHIVGVASNTTIYLYVDGSFIGDNIINLETVYPKPFIIGSSDFAYASNGTMIDEVGIWSRALTPLEISALYNGGSGLTYPFI